MDSNKEKLDRMESNKEKLDRIVKLYDNLGSFFDKIPDAIPSSIKEKLKNAILEDKELKKLIEDIREPRAPRLQLIGNTGHGKSSLINALLGYYAASVSDVKIGTKTNSERYSIKDENDNDIYTILDSRGINESTNDGNNNAEETLLKDITDFTPDTILYVHSASVRAGMDEEIKFIKQVDKKYKEKNGQKLPIIFVLNKCDELTPATLKDPKQYNQLKKDTIQEARDYFSNILRTNGIETDKVVIVSSLMEYYNYTKLQLDEMTIEQRRALVPDVDGRYNIDKLAELLLDSIEDTKALMGAAASFRINNVLKSVAKKFTHIFAGIAGTIALEPIPIGDIFILCALEAVLVMLIAYLAGRDISFKTAGELVLSFGGVVGLGFLFRLIAQQGGKFANLLFPGAGSAISATIAASGVESVGKAASKYFFEE